MLPVALIAVLALVSGCVGRDSPLSFLNVLRIGGATATPTLPPPPAIVTATLPPPAVAATPTLTLPAPGAGGQADAVVNATSDVNLREGPGTNYGIVGTAGPGEALSVLGRSESASWFRVQTASGVLAWIYGELITLNISAADLPVVLAPPPPAGGSQPPATQAPGGGAAGGPLEFSWTIVGVPTVDETNAYHLISINARGGSGAYTYYRDGQQLSSNQFVLAWTRCAGVVATTIRVDSSDGQSVSQPIGFNAFCPTPIGCSDCQLWSP
ncbi:MAG: hypothetical protein Kow00120_28590 [Anaerolineae bacterium]